MVMMVAKYKAETNQNIDDKIKSKLTKIMGWIGFYRFNIHRFVDDYLEIKLKLFQKILLVMMDSNMYFVFLAARGIGKTFLIAIYCCVRCILYPGTQIVIASGSRQQATEVIQKILGGEILGKSPNLAREIKAWKDTPQEAWIKFYNRSTITVVTSNQKARGKRSNILIVDEFRLVDKDTIVEVLQPFNAVPRQPNYLNNPKYEHLRGTESNKEIYMSSAWYVSHWSYDFSKMYAASMIQGREYFICGLPYQLAILEGIADRRDIENKMLEDGWSPTKWGMERECIFFGEAEQAFFTFDDLDKARTLELPLYTQDVYNYIDNKNFKYRMKKHGEIRILTVDVALMGGKNNDATAIFVIQLELIGNEKYKQYRRNVIYGETHDGGHAAKQSIQIRRLFGEFDCDYIVLDTNGNGMAIYDDLVEDIFDKERLVPYKALSCMNNEDMAKRCNYIDAPKVIYAVKGNASFNSDCAVMLRDDFKQGKMRLLLNCDDGERLLKSFKFYKDLDSALKADLLLPYVQTHLLIDEMVNLQSEIKDNVVRLKEQSNKRKDRYSSLSYGNYFARVLERNLTKPQSRADVSKLTSLARKPNIYNRKTS